MTHTGLYGAGEDEVHKMIAGMDLSDDRNVRICIAGRGIVLDQPSLVVVSRQARQRIRGVVAVGRTAERMLEASGHELRVVNPFEEGAVADGDMMAALVSTLLQKVCGSLDGLDRLIVLYPGWWSESASKELYEILVRCCGAPQIKIIPSLDAAAIGTGLPASARDNLIVIDLGASTTQVRIPQEGKQVDLKPILVGGDDLVDAVTALIREEHHLVIRPLTAERIVNYIGSASPLEYEFSMTVPGRDLFSGTPREAIVSTEQVRSSLLEVLEDLTKRLNTIFSQRAFTCDTQVLLVGRVAQMRVIGEFMAERLGSCVQVPHEPGLCVIRGLPTCLEKDH